MTINTWVIVERSVYEGIVMGITNALRQKDALANPEQIIDIVHNAVMNELALIIDFDQQAVETTPLLQDTLSELTNKNESGN